jgi:hypothetical protein
LWEYFGCIEIMFRFESFCGWNLIIFIKM